MLADMQRLFANGINADVADILIYIAPHADALAQDQLANYKQAIRQNYCERLKNIYSVMASILAENFFLQLLNAFIDQSPCYSADLSHYGENFADFIGGFAPAKALPYLADLARFEWAAHRLAGQRKPVSKQTQLNLPSESALILTPYPIHVIWELHAEINGVEKALQFPAERFYYIFLHAHNGQLTITLLEKTDWLILQWISAGFNDCQLQTALANHFPTINIKTKLNEFKKNGWLRL